MKEREIQYDLLRILCALAVVMLHVSSTYIGGLTGMRQFGAEILPDAGFTCLCNSNVRFAVPCFVMISGAMIMCRPQNKDYGSFYQKTFHNIGIPTLVFSAFYLILRIIFLNMDGKAAGEIAETIFLSAIKGNPYYHMWYLYMMLVVYALVPIALRFKESIDYKYYERAVLAFFVLSIASCWTQPVPTLNWNIGRAFEMMSYFLLGDVLRARLGAGRKELSGPDSKSPRTRLFLSVILILAGFAILFGISRIQLHHQVIAAIMDDRLEYRIGSMDAPLAALASILIFAGVAGVQMRQKKSVAQEAFDAGQAQSGTAWITRLSSLSLYLYLIHAGVWDVIKRIFVLPENVPVRRALHDIPWMYALTLAVSAVLAWGCLKMERRLKEREIAPPLQHL